MDRLRYTKCTSLFDGQPSAVDRQQRLEQPLKRINRNPKSSPTGFEESSPGREEIRFKVFQKRIAQTAEKTGGIVDEKYIAIVAAALERMDETVQRLAKMRDVRKVVDILAVAQPLQQAMRMVAHAWMHLWSMTAAIPKLKALTGDLALEAVVKDNTEAAFYCGKILSDQCYIGTELKHLHGYLDYIMTGEPAVVNGCSEEIFTGALPQKTGGGHTAGPLWFPVHGNAPVSGCAQG